MRLILFVFLLLSSSTFSQDTIRIYFDFGSSKIDLLGKTELSTLSANYDLNQLDSIQFIGYADSVGNMNANMRLSRKRAKNTYKMVKQQIDKNLVFSILARGEGKKDNPAQNRRVELILHHELEDSLGGDEEIANVDPKCFFTDSEALQFCNVRPITKKRKKYAHIEAMNIDYFRKTKHYYVKTDSKGNVDIKRLKWKKKKTGMLWWRKARYIAEIPLKSYNKFQFFTLGDPPCDGCKVDILAEDTVIINVWRRHPDMFLMDNFQSRITLFGKNKFKIRVPREYVDLSDNYYAWSKDDPDYREKSINWKIKKGKKRQNYYFARIELPNNQYPVIGKYSHTSFCKGVNKVYSNGGWGHWNPCGTRWTGNGRYGEFNLDISPGAFYQNDTVTGFLALGVLYNYQNASASVRAGINTRLGLYASAKVDFGFAYFPLASINPVSTWKGGGMGRSFKYFGNLYGGLEVKTSFNRAYTSFVEPNIHLGFAISKNYGNAPYNEWYIQSGIGRDLLNRVSTQFYPYVEMGFVFHLF